MTYLILLLQLFSTVISYSDKPNIIFVFVDDLGSADVGYAGSDILTPSINRLARSGVILNQHYVQPMCAPSRAAFITGRYPIHTGFQNGNIQLGELWGLGLDEVTVGEMLQEYGYKTHAIGKWHLGWETWRHTPIHRGFDTFFGFYFCAHDHYAYDCGNMIDLDPIEKMRKRKIKGELGKKDKKRMRYDTWRTANKLRNRENEPFYNKFPNVFKSGPRAFDLRENYFDKDNKLVDRVRKDLVGQYSAEIFTQYAVDVINNSSKADKDEPFFVYLSYMNVHAPYQVPKRYVEKYTQHMNLGVGDQRIKYAAMMSSVDEGISNITRALLRTGTYNNTVIVFASDNGANVATCGSDGLLYNRLQAGSNYPLRGGKRSIFEGGIKSVAFIHSPLITSPRRKTNKLIHVTDWFPTFEDIASDGFRKKPKFASRRRNPIDGISAWSTLRTGGPGMREKFIINIDNFGRIPCGPWTPFRAVRKKEWKLILGGGGPPSGWYNPFSKTIESPAEAFVQLYNIKVDPSETKNLAEDFPHIVSDLAAELDYYNISMVPALRRKRNFRKSLSEFLVGDVVTPKNFIDLNRREDQGHSRSYKVFGMNMDDID